MANHSRRDDPHEEDITLISKDEQALDRAWETITEAEITASIEWLESLPPPQHRSRKPHQKENPDHG